MNQNTSGTMPQYASLPRQMQLSPRGVSSEPVSRRFPDIIAGVCEFCGIIDKRQPGEYQYKLCPHYRGMDMRCNYCPLTENQEEVVRGRTIKVAEDPFRPGVLVTWCNSTECGKKHRQKYTTR